MTRPVLAVFGAAALFAGGCNAVPTLDGKVIEGSTGFVGVIDAADPRLDGPGIEDAEVLVTYDRPRQGGKTVRTVRSGRQGAFTAKLEGFNVMRGPVEILVRKPGYTAARGQMLVHGEDRRLLATLRPEAPGLD
jgi:hypothetical protein